MTALTDLPEESAQTAPSALGPRTRWAGIIWGVFFSAVAFAGLWIVGSAERREDAAAWLATLTPPIVVGMAVLAAGILLLVAGLVGLLRRAQKSIDARLAASRVTTE